MHQNLNFRYSQMHEVTFYGVAALEDQSAEGAGGLGIIRGNKVGESE